MKRGKKLCFSDLPFRGLPFRAERKEEQTRSLSLSIPFPNDDNDNANPPFPPTGSPKTFDKLWSDLRNITADMFLAGSNAANCNLKHSGWRCGEYAYSPGDWELFGIDFMFDADFKPWVLEVRRGVFSFFFFLFIDRSLAGKTLKTQPSFLDHHLHHHPRSTPPPPSSAAPSGTRTTPPTPRSRTTQRSAESTTRRTPPSSTRTRACCRRLPCVRRGSGPGARPGRAPLTRKERAPRSRRSARPRQRWREKSGLSRCLATARARSRSRPARR